MVSCSEVKRLLEPGTSAKGDGNTSLHISESTTESVENIMECLNGHLEISEDLKNYISETSNVSVRKRVKVRVEHNNEPKVIEYVNFEIRV